MLLTSLTHSVARLLMKLAGRSQWPRPLLLLTPIGSPVARLFVRLAGGSTESLTREPADCAPVLPAPRKGGENAGQISQKLFPRTLRTRQPGPRNRQLLATITAKPLSDRGHAGQFFSFLLRAASQMFRELPHLTDPGLENITGAHCADPKSANWIFPMKPAGFAATGTQLPNLRGGPPPAEADFNEVQNTHQENSFPANFHTHVVFIVNIPALANPTS